MDSATLIVKEPFEAFGKSYNQNDEFDMADAKVWPKGTLKRRIENGFLGFNEDAMEEQEEQEDEDSAAVLAAAAKSGRRSFSIPTKKDAPEGEEK